MKLKIVLMTETKIHRKSFTAILLNEIKYTK
jgi:hypothetical protein